jgi:tetratricopeptide (TPR) repeat protein
MKKIILLLVLITLAVYFNTLNNSFVWDDHFTIEENDLIKDIKYIPKIFITDLFYSYAEKNAAEHRNYYRPIQTLSFLIDYHIWRLNPFGFHLSNIFLHLANGILVFIAVFLICKSRIVSLFTSVLFLVHPVQTGAVAYLTGRSDILACFFLLISFIFYIRYRSTTPPGRIVDNDISDLNPIINFIADRKRLFYLISVSAFVIALLSKEVAVIFPLILIFWDMVYKKHDKLPLEENRPLSFLKKYSAYFIIDVTYIALRLSVLNFTPEKKIFQNAHDIYNQLLTMCRTLMEYIGLLIYPTNLHMERDVPLATLVFKVDIVSSLVGIVFLLFLAFVFYKRSRTIFFGIAWFIIFLIPASNIIPINALMAEHWLYIPSVGFFLIISILFLKPQFIKINYNFILASFVLLASIYSYKTIVRNVDWKDDLSIYFATLKFSAKKAKLYYNIGTVYNSRGRMQDAVRFYKLAIDDGMERAEVYTNLAIAYLQLGYFKEAKENFKSALALNPNDPFAHNGFGGLFEKMGLAEEAICEYKKAIECSPNFYDAHVNLGVVYDKQGKFREAIDHFEKALYIRKDESSYYNLGYAYYRAGDVKKAREIWDNIKLNIKNEK